MVVAVEVDGGGDVVGDVLIDEACDGGSVADVGSCFGALLLLHAAVSMAMVKAAPIEPLRWAMTGSPLILE